MRWDSQIPTKGLLTTPLNLKMFLKQQGFENPSTLTARTRDLRIPLHSRVRWDSQIPTKGLLTTPLNLKSISSKKNKGLKTLQHIRRGI
ncbi:hypothetical protein DTQ70_04530 [Runella sp. SP2]|nr:hypothetical protein DTQ70_04530 [Runella sp. SP2]